MAKNSPDQETGLGNRGHLKVINDTKWDINKREWPPQSFSINLVSFRVSWLGLFFAVSYCKLALVSCSHWNRKCHVKVKDRVEHSLVKVKLKKSKSADQKFSAGWIVRLCFIFQKILRNVRKSNFRDCHIPKFIYYISKEVGVEFRELHFLLIFSTIHADVGSWVGLKKAQKCRRNISMVPNQNQQVDDAQVHMAPEVDLWVESWAPLMVLKLLAWLV